MIILGIDPGYAIIGYGVLEYSNNHFKVLGYGAITTKAGTPFNQRLELIYRELDLIMTKYMVKILKIQMLKFMNIIHFYPINLTSKTIFTHSCVEVFPIKHS